MPRKTLPKIKVAMRKRVTNFFLPTWADQTDIAMVSELPIRTTVLMAPQLNLMVRLEKEKTSAYVWRFMVYVRKRPPKNKISVDRKIHMPSVADSFCCSSV